MAITYALGPNPKWYFVNNNGKPLAGGKFNTYSSLNNSQRKNVFTTPSGDFPLPNPATIDANGTLGPFWFQFDSNAPDDGYLIIVTDANGQVIWTADDYFVSGGGGGNTTIVLNIVNLINNNVMFRHCDTITPVPTFSVIAPSNNANLVGNGTINTAAPDIIFVKNNQSGTDMISFPKFSLGDEPITNDTAPVDYFNYTMSVAGTETTKFLQFPITAKVQNLSNQDIIGSFWARSNGGTANTITLQWFQFFGDGAGASVPVSQQINVPFVLTSSWAKYNFQDTVPDVNGKSLGAPNSSGPNDALFLQIVFPLSATCNIDFTKPTMYLDDNNLPDLDFIGYDNIDSVIAIPRTGDARISINSFVPFGWVPCNDGVLSNGDGAIVAPTLVPVSRNNVDTYPLYYMIWNLTNGYQTFAPIYDNAGVATTRGADAISDFAAGKQLSLTKMLGRVLAGANPTLIASQSYVADATADNLTVSDATQFPTGTPVLLTNTGGTLPTFALTNSPPIYYSIYIDSTHIKLAISEDYALAGTVLDITGIGTGAQTIQTANGTYFGEGRHVQTVVELALHSHTPFSGGGTFQVRGGIGTGFGGAGGAASDPITSTTGQSAPFNVMQPTAFLNIMLKL